MEVRAHLINNRKFIEIVSDKIIVSQIQDGLDLIGECMGHDSEGIIINQKNVSDSFFDLSTRIAGEILQKFSTYNLRLAIVGNFFEYTSKSLKDFIFESNKQGRINFVNSVEEAISKLSK